MAKPIVGVNAVVEIAPIGDDGTVGTYINLYNSEYTITPKAKIKEAPNTTDGMLRSAGLRDYELKVKGHTDYSLPASTPIEINVMPGSILQFRAHRSYAPPGTGGTAPTTGFWGGRIIIGEDLSIATGVDQTEDWEFSGLKQSGTLTTPKGDHF